MKKQLLFLIPFLSLCGCKNNDLTVTYKVGDTVVFTDTIKKGKRLESFYVYDNPNHQNYAKSWKDTSGESFLIIKEIYEDLVLTAQLEDNLKLLTTSTDSHTFINGINHVHPDGKVVVMPTYFGKEVCLGNFGIYNNDKVREVYLPATLARIFYGNFSNCANLTTIYFAGTEDQWNAIPKEFASTPSTVSVVYNTSFYF